MSLCFVLQKLRMMVDDWISLLKIVKNIIFKIIYHYLEPLSSATIDIEATISFIYIEVHQDGLNVTHCDTISSFFATGFQSMHKK